MDRKVFSIGLAIGFVVLMTAVVIENIEADPDGTIRVEVYETCYVYTPNGGQRCGSRNYIEWDYVYPDPHLNWVWSESEQQMVQVHNHGWRGIVGNRRDHRPRYVQMSCSECW